MNEEFRFNTGIFIILALLVGFASVTHFKNNPLSPSTHESSVKIPTIVEDLALLEKEQKKFNLNTASLSQLKSIPTISEKKAQMIINYKNEHGNFSSIEELLNINGINSLNYECLQERVYIN